MATKSTRKRKTKKVVPKGYDSILEYDLHRNQLKGCTYHPEERIQYEIPHSYEPDFVAQVCSKHGAGNLKRRCCSSCKEILVEVKGRFRTSQEARKYRFVREALKENQEVIFLFQDSSKPMPFAGRRKDGTKQTHGEWAERNGFRYYCLKKGLPDAWLTDLT